MKRSRFQRRLVCERLESRLVLSTVAPLDTAFSDPGHGGYQAVIVAGDPNGSPADSPANRVDANTASSPYAGVGSLRISATGGTYICSATVIGTQSVLTAGHCVDLNNDGKYSIKDGILGITFNLNYGSDLSHQLAVSTIKVHPEFSGFGRPSVNDDVAVLGLASAVPSGVPIYTLYSGNLAGKVLQMVGYGRSGDGVTSTYSVDASFTVKRQGENVADAFYGQDDRRKPSANEVFRFDFDAPTGNGTFGGSTLGNDRETQLGGGDSGGPSFVDVSGSLQIAGINTFTQGSAPLFGSLGGGMAVPAYGAWINSVITSPTSTSSSSDEGSGGPAGPSQGKPSDDAVVAAHLVSTLVVEPTSDPQIVTTTELTSVSVSDNQDGQHDEIVQPDLFKPDQAGGFSRTDVAVATTVALVPEFEWGTQHRRSSNTPGDVFDTVLDEWLLLAN